MLDCIDNPTACMRRKSATIWAFGEYTCMKLSPEFKGLVVLPRRHGPRARAPVRTFIINAANESDSTFTYTGLGKCRPICGYSHFCKAGSPLRHGSWVDIGRGDLLTIVAGLSTCRVLHSFLTAS